LRGAHYLTSSTGYRATFGGNGLLKLLTEGLEPGYRALKPSWNSETFTICHMSSYAGG
jgi:hypothetical protein